ncbi:hypothetical protein CDD80_1886 [Ophiocordyceps camponoti-rufipedis]|uniref:Hydrophobin n=1 Tax=Ophiocordyceps camponoti-rufipedis TaxID=2004952 RepID=A0A2C5ZA33_9HYPO|nr:hypothetical protein CDD80_1886 [Ophiocordyceps camponoti-rufipedis]
MKALTILLATLPLALSVENTQLGIMETSGSMGALGGALTTAEAGDKPDGACSGTCGKNILSQIHDQAHCIVGAVLPIVKQAVFHKDCPRQYLNCCWIKFGNKKPQPGPGPTPNPNPAPTPPGPSPINWQQMYQQWQQQSQQSQQSQQFYPRPYPGYSGYRRSFRRSFEA